MRKYDMLLFVSDPLYGTTLPEKSGAVFVLPLLETYA